MGLKLTPVKRFINLLKVDRQEIMSIYIFALFNGILSLTLPLGIQAIINFITGGQVSTSWIVLVVLVILGVGLTGVMQIMQLAVTENLQQKIFTRSAFEFAYRIPRMKFDAVDKSYMPEMVNRFFDTLSVQKGLSKILVDFSSASLQVIFGLILLSLYHSFFIFFSLVLVLIVYIIFRYTIPSGLSTSLKESEYKYEVAHWLEETARAMETFKLTGNSPLPLEKTDEVVNGYLKARKSHFKTLLVQYINLVGFKVVIAAGLLLMGGLLVINQQMNIGQFVASEIIIILVLASIEKLIISMETIYDVLTAIEKLGYVTDIPLERDNGSRINLEKGKGISLELKNISYSIDESEDDLLRKVDFQIDAGDKVCLSGFQGSGKTLLLQLIAGLYNDFSGAIVYNGVPLPDWCKEELYSIIGDNLSEEDIFKGTLYENITLGKPGITLEKVQEIVQVLGLSEFIATLPGGYNTVLIPGGRSLPKSIRLKIILARSVVPNPNLILLEDSFNQLLPKYKERFLEYVLSQDSTVIAVSNDESVANKFSKTLIMDRGELIGFDKLSQLQQKDWYSTVFQKR